MSGDEEIDSTFPGENETGQSIDLSIIICTYNRYDVLSDAISSIERQSLDRSRYQLVVVDNSTDAERQSRFSDAISFECAGTYIVESAPGLSRARNIGLARSSGRLVAFIDDDAMAERHWAEAIVNGFAASERIGVLGGPVRPIWPALRPVWLHPWMEGYFTIVDRGRARRELPPNEWLAGTNIAFRREALVAAGGFSEAIGRIGKLLLSNEELLVSDKIRAQGFTIVYDPDVTVQHRVHEDRVSQIWLRKRVAWQSISEIIGDPNKGSNDVNADIRGVLEFLAKMPARDRGLHGLFADTDDPELFRRQAIAIGAMTRLLICGGVDWRTFLEENA